MTRPQIVFCHRHGNDYSECRPFAGVQSAREIVARSLACDEPAAAVLIFGLHDEQFVRDRVNRYWPGAAAVLDWPGVEYMRYDVSVDALTEGAARVVAGASEGSSRQLLQNDRAGLLKLSSEIRHWLENRHTNVTGLRDDFRQVVRGEEVSRFHLEPQPAIAEEHRAMVDRLWAYDWLAAANLSRVGGTSGLRAAMDEFESSWAALTGAKMDCTVHDRPETAREKREAVIHAADRVLSAIRAAIDGTRVLDRAVGTD